MAGKRRATSQGGRRPKRMRRTAVAVGRSRFPRILGRAIVPKLAIKRTQYMGSWQFATTTTNDFWRYVTMDTSWINNFAELAAVFDEYKVNGIKVTYRPRYDTVQVGQGPQAYAHVLIDPASTLIPLGTYSSANLNTFLENQGVKTYTLNRPFSIYYKPRVMDQVQGGGTAAVASLPKYIRTTETAVLFRGYHIFLQQNNMAATNANVILDVFVTVYATLRNLK